MQLCHRVGECLIEQCLAQNKSTLAELFQDAWTCDSNALMFWSTGITTVDRTYRHWMKTPGLPWDITSPTPKTRLLEVRGEWASGAALFSGLQKQSALGLKGKLSAAWNKTLPSCVIGGTQGERQGTPKNILNTWETFLFSWGSNAQGFHCLPYLFPIAFEIIVLWGHNWNCIFACKLFTWPLSSPYIIGFPMFSGTI